MNTEMQKIGEFPRNNQQIRRKEELSTEISIINSNMGNIKNKIKMLKAWSSYSSGISFLSLTSKHLNFSIT